MYSQSILAFLFIAVLGLMSAYLTKAQGSSDEATVRMAGEHLSAYSNFVTAYARANTSTSGHVSDAQVAVPSWFSRLQSEGNYVAVGRSYVFVTPPNVAKGFAMARVINSPNAGVKVNGALVVPGRVAGQALPAAVPEGSVVVAQ